MKLSELITFLYVIYYIDFSGSDDRAVDCGVGRKLLVQMPARLCVLFFSFPITISLSSNIPQCLYTEQ